MGKKVKGAVRTDPFVSPEYIAHRTALLLKDRYNPDQPRDEHGRWTYAGGGSSDVPVDPDRIVPGDPRALANFEREERLRRGGDLSTVAGRPSGMNPVKYGDIAKDPVRAFGIMDAETYHAPGPTPHDSMGTMGRFSKDGIWDDSRRPIHDRVFNGFYKNVDEPPTGERVVYMTGGGFGSGKSTVLEKFRDVIGFPSENSNPTCDPDAAKQLLPEMAMRVALRDIGAASYVHEESSALAKAGVEEALRAGYSPVYDTSGDSTPEKLAAKVREMKEEWGATEVRAAYVFSGSIDESWKRVQERQARSQGLRRELTLPQVEANAYEVARCWFASAKNNVFDDLKLYSTDGPFGSPPRHIATARGGKLTEVSDAKTLGVFRDMAGLTADEFPFEVEKGTSMAHKAEMPSSQPVSGERSNQIVMDIGLHIAPEDAAVPYTEADLAFRKRVEDALAERERETGKPVVLDIRE